MALCAAIGLGHHRTMSQNARWLMQNVNPHFHQYLHGETLMSIETEYLAGKVVFEVGSGRVDTTRKLVDILSRQPGHN